MEDLTVIAIFSSYKNMHCFIPGRQDISTKLSFRPLTIPNYAKLRQIGLSNEDDREVLQRAYFTHCRAADHCKLLYLIQQPF